MKVAIGGLKKQGRILLAKLLRGSPNYITVSSASKILGMDNQKTSMLLSSWAERGWLFRIKRGLYIPVSLQATNPEAMPDDPKLIANEVFKPCYIGGWSAAEHWNLTEQMFNTVVVLTLRKISDRKLQVKGIKFQIKTKLNFY